MAEATDSVFLHEQATRCRHGPLLSPARTLKGVTEGALPQHGSYQNLKHSQTQEGYKHVQKGSCFEPVVLHERQNNSSYREIQTVRILHVMIWSEPWFFKMLVKPVKKKHLF